MFSLANLKIFPPLIVITFLMTLRSPHLLLNHLDLFRSLLNNLWSNHSTFSRFIPTQRRPTSPTIQCLKRSHTNARMKTIVVGELYQRQIAIPSSTFL